MFLQNYPLREDDKENLLNICPNTAFWGGTVSAYFDELGQYGLSNICHNQLFSVFQTDGKPDRKAIDIQKFYFDKGIRYICVDDNNPAGISDARILRKDKAYKRQLRIP